MGSLMKRNFNRPRPEAPGDRRLFVDLAIHQVFKNHGHRRQPALMDHYKANPLTVSRNVIDLWAKSHTTADVLAAATLIEGGLTDPSTYRLMPKDVPKPAMSLTAQGQVAVGQTVVYHSKDIISLTAGVFTLALSRLLTYFDHNIRFAFGADEHTSGEWADRLGVLRTHFESIGISRRRHEGHQFLEKGVRKGYSIFVTVSFDVYHDVWQ
ncbi:hypothetical protein HI914_03769 [Erysiphe necator]|nr:hypothetical protein HI914_03769 [Erysiphe necator]